MKGKLIKRKKRQFYIKDMKKSRSIFPQNKNYGKGIKLSDKKTNFELLALKKKRKLMRDISYWLIIR